MARTSRQRRPARQQRVLRLRRSDFTIDLSLTIEPDGVVLIGLAIAGPRSARLTGPDVDLEVSGAHGPFNATAFPIDAPLPQLVIGPARGAIATFRFEPVFPRDTPEMLVGRVQSHEFAIRVDDERHEVKPGPAVPQAIRAALRNAPPPKA